MALSQEARLIEAAQNGDQEAVAALYQMHVDAVYRYIYVRVSQVAIAEDITSDVFVRALETLSKYEQRGVPFLGWLYRIAHGRVIDHYRRTSRRPEHQNIENMVLQSDDDPEQETINILQQEQVFEYLHQLTEEQQQVVMLRFIQGHNLQTTAQLMGKTEGAVKGLQYRALQALGKLFEAETNLE